MRISLLLLLVVSSALPSYGQGFGKTKRKVTLERRLPAAVHLTGTAIQVKSSARDPRNGEVAKLLQEILEAELLKNDKRLKLEAANPETVISCAVTTFSIAPPRVTLRPAVVAGQPPQRVYRITGQLTAVYRTEDLRAGRALDSDTLTSSFDQEFDESGERIESQSLPSTLVTGIKKSWEAVRGGEKARPSSGPPRSLEEVRQVLVHQTALQVAARIVETKEGIEVLLARGKLDEQNRYADARLWSRMLEPLETMTPFAKTEDDAYRLYNIGVVYEALAYQAEDLKAAKKFFDQAAISYGKAIDAKPDEKYFLEPQNRIQTAIAHYKKLEEHAASNRTAPPSALVPAPPAAVPPTAPPPAIAAPAPAGPTSIPAQRPPTPAPPKTTRIAAPPAKSDGPLTNEQVIRLARAGWDESKLIAAIRNASVVKFDFEISDVIRLSEHGIKGAVLAAMRERAARPASSKSVAR
jgi:hypothetical protein